VGELPGLSPWHEKNVLLYRCRDLSKEQFLQTVNAMYVKIEELYLSSLPETMEEETYLLAKEYYDAAAKSLDCYLEGLEALKVWADTGAKADLDHSRLHFATGDKFSKDVLPLMFEAQESFAEAEIAVLRSQGIDPGGID
jgi:hypothetical protein